MLRACLETSAFIVTRRHVDKKRLCAAAKTREDCQTKNGRLYVLSCPLLLEKVGGAKQTCVRSSMRCAISYVLDVRGGCSRKNSGRGKLSTGGFDD